MMLTIACAVWLVAGNLYLARHVRRRDYFTFLAIEVFTVFATFVFLRVR